MQMNVALPERQSHIRLHNGSQGSFSDEAFVEFCRANPNLRIERNSHGDLIVMPPAGGESSSRNADVTTQLGSWAAKNGRGRAFDSSAGFRLPDGSILSPAAWLSLEALCPEFVVEIRSPRDNLAEVKEKMELWMANGAQLGWLIDGDARTVHVYRKHRRAKTHRAITELVGEGPVKGFVLKLAAVWRGLA